MSRLQRVLLLTGIISLFASYVALWIRFINDPVQRTGADFIHFYSAGRIAQSHGPSRVYDLELQQNVEEEQLGFQLASGQLLPYNHLPFLIPILQIAINDDYVSSFYRWAAILITTYGISVLLLSSVLKQAGVERKSIHIVAIGSMLFLPVFFSLMNGQDTAILFLGTAIWVYGLSTGQYLLSGTGLSLTTVRPHIALALALPLFFGNRRVFWGFLLGSGFLATVSLFLLGVQGTQEFINILVLSAAGEGYGIKQYAMYNLIGLLTRMFPWADSNTIRIAGWLIYGLSITGLCILWGKKRNPKNDLINLSVILALFVAPHLYFHDLAILIVPIYELIRSGKNRGRGATAAILLPIVISLLLLISNISVFLQYTTPYLVMLGLAVYPFVLRQKDDLTPPHRSRSPGI